MIFHIDFSVLPEVTMAGRMKQIRGWEHNGRIVDVNILVCVLSGECVFHLNDTDYFMKDGDIILLPADTFYTARTDSACEYYFFHFSTPSHVTAMRAADTAEAPPAAAADDFRDNRRSIFTLPRTDRGGVWVLDRVTEEDRFENVLLLIDKCLNRSLEQTCNQKLLIDLHFAEILLLLSQISADRLYHRQPFPPVLSKMLLYIRRNYTKRITLAALSENFGVSRQYIIRLFRAHLGTTATRYINSLKLSHACELLRRSTMNVGEIAEYLGFGSPYYFSRLFRSVYRMTPGQYVRSELDL